MDGIVVRNIRKSFGETQALKDASFEACMGEVHAVVGENGSGKSTLAKIISGVLEADAGSVQVLGVRPLNPRHTRQIGVATIFQEMMLAEQLTITANVFAGVDGFLRRALSSESKKSETKALLERLSGQPIDPEARVADLPLHLKQWIVLGRAIRSNPRVLILDESSAALGLAGTERLHGEIRRLRDAGACVVIVTHRIAELVKIADRATVLRDGVTVGTLGKSEITEQNLLRLMSAATPGVRAEVDNRADIVKPQIALRGDAIVLKHEATPFDFKVHEGEIVGLAGLDGAGQAAFVRALAGIERPLSGSVEASSASGGDAPIRSIADADSARVAYVSGDRKREGIFPNLSILENFGMPLYSRHRGRTGLIDRTSLGTSFEAEVARLGIRMGAPTNRITSLSGGNQQKVLIARALAADPRVIVLNDPARGVDIGTKQELYRQLIAFAARGGAVVYLSSEIEEFFDFADRVDVFVNAALRQTLRAGDVAEEPLLYAMFGQARPDATARVVREIA